LTETNLNLILEHHISKIEKSMLEFEEIAIDFSVALDFEMNNFNENLSILQKNLKRIYFKGVNENESGSMSIEATKSTS
jgi:hypothetical protein